MTPAPTSVRLASQACSGPGFMPRLSNHRPVPAILPPPMMWLIPWASITAPRMRRSPSSARLTASGSIPVPMGVTLRSPPVHLDLLVDPFDASWPQVRDLAVAAEERGWDGVWTWDHLSGVVHGQGHVLEGWTLLSALAAVTSG